MTTSARDVERLNAALDALTDALEAHLTACLHRTGEADAAVQAAYTALRNAAERYDDLLFDVLDEVTPWEFPTGPAADAEYENADAVADALAVLVRRDYTLDDPDALLAAGRRAYLRLYPEDPEAAARTDVTHAGRALFQMLHAYGVDGLDDRAEDSGLVPRGATVWVQALAEGDEETLTDDPFGIADEDLLVYRMNEQVESEDDTD